MLLSLLLAPALATRLFVPLPTLCARAPVVLVGEVTSIDGRWSSGQTGGIESVVEVAVVRRVKGDAPDNLNFVVAGGKVGHLSMKVSEAPKLQRDARYVLLLTPTPEGWSLVGGADGVIEVPWDEGGEARALALLGDCHV